MKLAFCTYIIFILATADAQSSSRIIAPQANVEGNPQNIVYVDKTPGNLNRVYVSSLDSLKKIILPNTGTPGTYNRTTTDAQGRVTAGAVDSSYTITRALNSTFVISATRVSTVVYSIQIVSMGGQLGTVFLEYSPDGVTWTEASRVTNMSTATNTQVAPLVGRIPANYFVQLRSTGTTTNTYISGQETQL